ncbi:zinc finger, CCHC-type containing protein [Tanacetum coccineum]
MGDKNPICTLGDYSKPSHEGYRNTIELPEGNNAVPLRSDTIWERTRLRLFQFSLRDQANWLERRPAGSISTWEDLTNRFLAQFFPPGRTAKLHNDILMFQQHQGKSLSEAYTRFKDLLQKVPHHGIDLWLKVQFFYDHVNPTTKRTIDQSAGVQRLMEAHLAPKKPIQVNKINSSCEICSGPHDTQYCMENPEQAFVDYAFSQGLVSNFMISQDARLSKFEGDFKQQQSKMTNKIDTVLKAITDRMAGALPSDTVKNPKLNVNLSSSVLSARSYPTDDPQCSSHPSNSINVVKKCSKETNHPQKDQPQPVIKIRTQRPEEA